MRWKQKSCLETTNKLLNMRNYNVTNYPREAEEAFDYLIEKYGYSMKFKETTFGYLLIYSNKSSVLNLNYDCRDNFYYFDLIRGKDTEYPNDLDNENIRPLFKLVQKHDPNFDVRKLQPNDDQYLEALKLNAIMLKKYGDKVLKGEEWF